MKNTFRYMALSVLLICMIACDHDPSSPGSSDGGKAPQGVEAVDLGLPSGLKWANMNVSASTLDAYGLYFAWGETVGYGSDTSDGHFYDETNYKWCDGSYDRLTKYCTISRYGTVDNKTVLGPEDDIARANWGGSWRMPTDAEWTELRTECTWTWTTQNGVNGRLVTGPNGNSIFLPASGSRIGASLYGVGKVGIYWSSSLYTKDSQCALGVFFYYDRVGKYCDYRGSGQSIRPVISSPY